MHHYTDLNVNEKIFYLFVKRRNFLRPFNTTFLAQIGQISLNE